MRIGRKGGTGNRGRQCSSYTIQFDAVRDRAAILHDLSMPEFASNSSRVVSFHFISFQAGFARLERRRGQVRNPALAAVLDGLRERQEAAKKERLNIWQYGDVESDEEEERGGRRPAGKK